MKRTGLNLLKKPLKMAENAWTGLKLVFEKLSRPKPKHNEGQVVDAEFDSGNYPVGDGPVALEGNPRKKAQPRPVTKKPSMESRIKKEIELLRRDKTTFAEIARESGVAVNTVRRALDEPEKMTRITREKFADYFGLES